MKRKPYLFKQLHIHNKANPISFHVPGHKSGQAFQMAGGDFPQDILKIDQTEISGLDDLHHPDGVILESQKRAARLFGAEETFFLVNGSTAGNLAMILACCKPGDKILVQRNVHKSVIHGLILAKAIPIYLQPEFILQLGIAGSVPYHTIKQALAEHPDVKAVLLMNPNYYGIGMDMVEIGKLVHQYHIPLLIDEAHGAHFGLHESFPKSSIQMGADIVVQSTHKTLTAMTMGSMLHVRTSSLIDIERIRFFLSVVQSSSPSYPIMASLDATCDMIEKKGERLWGPIMKWLDELDEQMSVLKAIRLQHTLPKQYVLDPLKRIIHSRINNITGFELQKRLEQRGIFTELADLYNVLAIITFGNRKGEIDFLAESLLQLDQSFANQCINEGEINQEIEFITEWNITQPSFVSLDQIIYGSKVSIPIKESMGRIAAEMVIPYPPGIPVIQLGERITEEQIDYVLRLIEQGSRFQGIKDSTISTIQIVERA